MNLASFKKKVKIVGFAILLLLVLGVTIFFGRTASNYFAKASTCPVKEVSATQVTTNGAVISWKTEEVTQGRVEYGTNATNLTFSAPEASSGTTHNVPLTLLTPNTVYYYLIVIGNTRCDSSGQTCSQTCVPWSFTTTSITPPQEVAATHTPVPPTPISSPTTAVSPTTSVTITSVPSASPSSALSALCRQVAANIGVSSQGATSWATLKQYDIDNNGLINGLDIIKCQQSGK